MGVCFSYFFLETAMDFRIRGRRPEAAELVRLAGVPLTRVDKQGRRRSGSWKIAE